MPDTVAEFEIETLKKTLATGNGETIVDAVADTLEKKQVETLSDIVVKLLA